VERNLNMSRVGIIAAGIWCVDISYKINNWPEQGKTSMINKRIDGVGGGPSNVLTNLNYLGFNYPKIGLGCIGIDNNSKVIIQHCKKNKIITSYLSKLKKISTSYTLIMSEKEKERTFFHYPGPNDYLDIKYLQLTKIGNYKPRILYVGYLTFLGKLDLFKKNKETKLVDLLKKSHKLGMINCLDLASYNHKSYAQIITSALKYCDYLFLNEIEAELATGIKLHSKNVFNKKSAEKAIKKLLNLGVKKAIILHTPSWALWMGAEGDAIWLKSLKIESKKIKSTVGAGDAFAAASIFGIHEGWNPRNILKKSHAAARSILMTDQSSGNIPHIKKL
jgi:sugar/nucleoside kinase (ribokinase family)